VPSARQRHWRLAAAASLVNPFLDGDPSWVLVETGDPGVQIAGSSTVVVVENLEVSALAR